MSGCFQIWGVVEILKRVLEKDCQQRITIVTFKQTKLNITQLLVPEDLDSNQVHQSTGSWTSLYTSRWLDLTDGKENTKRPIIKDISKTKLIMDHKENSKIQEVRVAVWYRQCWGSRGEIGSDMHWSTFNKVFANTDTWFRNHKTSYYKNQLVNFHVAEH